VIGKPPTVWVAIPVNNEVAIVSELLHRVEEEAKRRRLYVVERVARGAEHAA
jgi:hypothetical protein